MEQELVQWMYNLIFEFAKFGGWLTTPLDYINITPLEMFGYTGLLIIIGYLLVRLVVGG